MDKLGTAFSTIIGHLPFRGVTALTGDWLVDWRSTDRKTIYLYASWFFGSSLFLLLYTVKSTQVYLALAPGQHPTFGDFSALWSYGQILVAHRGGDLFRGHQLHDFQIALGMKADDQAPFPYFPAFMILFRPLALLPLTWSYLAWSAGTLLLFAGVVSKTVSKAPWSILAVLIGPTTVISFACGQTGFLAAAFITAGLRLMRSRPILAGTAFGLLAYKPQLGLLVPVALLASGAWTSVIAASATIASLSAVATLCFGWQIWLDWLAQIPDYNTFFHRISSTLPIQPTVAGNLHLLGCNDIVANSAQVIVALAVIGLIWQSYRNASNRIADAALIVGTFLATPHAFVYDMPMVTAALCLYVEDRLQANGRFHGAEFLVMIITSVFPAVMFIFEPNLPISTICLATLLAMIIRRGNVTLPLVTCVWPGPGRLRTS
jgi:Glycosyltransferase family 87